MVPSFLTATPGFLIHALRMLALVLIIPLVAMSPQLFSETVVIPSSRPATRACIRVNAYQRRSVIRRRSDA